MSGARTAAKTRAESAAEKNVDRHPEVRAKRASKGDGPGASAASFEGRFAAASG